MQLAPRYELKYWADESQLADVLGRLAGLLVRDPHGSDVRPGYMITSLYLDTEDFAYFYEKVEGLKIRSKVRLRRYDDEMGGFLELKGKRKRRITKSRLRLDSGALERTTRGDTVDLQRMAAGGDHAARVLLSEFELRQTLVPAVITRYEREAYLLREDPAVRVSIDRRLSAWGQDLVEAFLHPEVSDLPMLPMLGSVPSGPAILEVKSTGPIPPVVAAALRHADLIRRAISKYCYAVLRSGSLPEPNRERFRVLFPEVPSTHA